MLFLRFRVLLADQLTKFILVGPSVVRQVKAQLAVASSRQISADVVHVEPLRGTTLDPIGDLVGRCYRSCSGARTRDVDKIFGDDFSKGSARRIVGF